MNVAGKRRLSDTRRPLERLGFARQLDLEMVFLVRRDDLRIVDANNGASAEYGYSRDELLTMTAYDLSPEQDRALTSSVVRSIDIGETRIQAAHRRKDGSIFLADYVARCLTLDDQRYIVSVGRKIGAAAPMTPASPVTHSEARGFDATRLREIFEDDDDAMHEFLVDALDSLMALVEKLGTAIESADIAAAKAVAHELKGSAANVGATTLAAASTEAELCATAADWQRMHAAANRVRDEMERLRTFVLTAPGERTQAAPPAPRIGTQRILAVDDSPVSLKLYERIAAELFDCTVVGFTSPVEALEWCVKEPVDLVLVDFVMPTMDGLEFLRRFRLLPDKGSVPVLMITAEPQRELRHRALEFGATDFLTKPADRVELLSRARNMLALRSQQMQLAHAAEFLSEQVNLAIRDIAAREQEAIFRLSRATEFRDTETGAHIVRMAHYCKLIGQCAGLHAQDVDELFAAAPMHDVGKVAIPDRILLKPGPLTAEEFDVIKTHTTIGHSILKDSPARLLQTAALIALTHHEKYDGSGYPQGTRGDDIPVIGRICALSDVFDALTSVRPYKRAWTMSEAVDEIHKLANAHFDPKLVAAFDEALPQIEVYKQQFSDEVLGTKA